MSDHGAAYVSQEENSLDLGFALARGLRGRASSLDAHLKVLQRDIRIANTQTTLHCYFLPLDGNGRVRFKPLADFLRDRIIDYAIPRRAIEEAQRRQAETGSTAPIVRLDRQARQLFTNIANSGEGGELLLFAMAEAVFGFSQILCKMSLKTSSQMHYHGADGVYAEARSDGGLNVFWAESKIYEDATSAIRECLGSLSPFLLQPSGADALRERDLLLINEFANFTDERLIQGVRHALDPDQPASLTTRHCGFALTAFDCDGYGGDPSPTIEKIEEAIRSTLPNWSERVSRRITEEALTQFDIHFICVPVPSAQEFRSYFLEQLGVSG